MKVILDRFEGNFAIVELQDGSMANLPRALVPEGAGEGAVIDITYNENETSDRKNRIRSKMDKLFKRAE